MKHLVVTLMMVIVFQFINKAYSQEQPVEKPVNYEELINKGIEYYDKGEYDEALKLFLLVNSSDPLYPWACYESSLVYYNQDKLDLALEKCYEALSYDWERPNVYSIITNSLNEKGKTDEGLKIALVALEKWPYNSQLLNGIANCYISKKEYEKAEPYLLKLAKIYPYNARAHSLLAKVNLAMGKIAQAYYAYNMSLLMGPSVNRLKEFEKAITGNLDSIKHHYNLDNNNKKWIELKEFLESEMAFNKNFNFDHKIDNTITRQTLMLFQKGRYDENDTSYYNQFYVRFNNELMKNDMFETYIYYIFQNAGFDYVKQWNEKNKKQINEFAEWAKQSINTYRDYAYNQKNEIKNTTYYHYNNNSVLTAIGELKILPDSIKQGHWSFIYNNGGISETGNYVNNKVQGEYKVFWDNGKLKKLLYFKDNKLEGKCQFFFKSGNTSGICTYKNDELNDELKNFNNSGLIETVESYIDGKANGLSTKYYYQDGLISKVNYKNGVAQGIRERYWLNGNKELELFFNNDSIDGQYKAFFSNGKLRTEGKYSMGNQFGLWKFYHWNGNLKQEGEFDETGNITGKWSYFSEDGRKNAFEENYDKGLLYGTRTNYYPNGQINSLLHFTKDLITNLEVIDSLGNTLYQAQTDNGKLSNKAYFSDGTLEVEGILNEDMSRHGEWNFYNIYGIKTKVFNYINGMKTGLQKTFFSNGQIKEEYNCDSNLVNGLYKEYFSNGKLKTIGWSLKDKNEGTWNYYYPNGSLKTKAYYSAGELVGYYELYSGDGTLEQQYLYSSDNKLVKQIKYFDNKGKMIDEFHLKNGDIKLIQKFNNDKIKTKCTYQMGMINDTLISYYKNGYKNFESIYLFGKLNGKTSAWDINGKLALEYNYIMGSEDGIQKDYEDGVVIRESNYENGVETGITKYYHYNGNIARIISMPNGERNGYTYYYSPDGQLMYRGFFIKGDIRSYSYLDQTGKYIKDIPISKDTKELVSYFQNGKVSLKAGYLNGELNGKRIEYYSNGKIYKETEFINDNYSGICKLYYPNGQIIEDIIFLHDRRHGIYTSYYENGKKKIEGNYIMDAKDGIWKYYDINGKLLNEVNYRNGSPCD